MSTRRTSSRIRINHTATSSSSSSLVVVSGPRVFPSELVSTICGFATKGTLAQLARVSKDVKVLAIEALYKVVVTEKAVDYLSLFSDASENFRTTTQTLVISAFPPRLLLVGFFCLLKENDLPIRIPRMIYHVRITASRLSARPRNLFSPSTIVIHPTVTFTIKKLYTDWTWGHSFVHAATSNLSSITYLNVERGPLIETAFFLPPFSLSRKYYPVLERIVLRLAPGVAKEDVEKDLDAWLTLLRTSRLSDGWQEEEADWRRVPVVEEA